MKRTLCGLFLLFLLSTGCSTVRYRSIELRCYDTFGKRIPPEDVVVFVFTQRDRKVWWESGVPHRLSLLYPTPHGIVDNIPQRTQYDTSFSSLSPIVLVYAHGRYPVDISYASTYLNERDLRETEPLWEYGMDPQRTFISPLRVTVCLPTVSDSTTDKSEFGSLMSRYVIDSFGNLFLLRSSKLPTLDLKSVDTSSLQCVEAKKLWSQLTTLPVLDGSLFQYFKYHFSLDPEEAVTLLIAFNRAFISAFNTNIGM